MADKKPTLDEKLRDNRALIAEVQRLTQERDQARDIPCCSCGGLVTTEDTTAAEAQWVVLRRADAEALIEEHALEDDPFWRPVSGVAVTLPPCSCGSISLYAEHPPRLGHHHQASCLRWRDRQTFRPAVRFSGLSEG